MESCCLFCAVVESKVFVATIVAVVVSSGCKERGCEVCCWVLDRLVVARGCDSKIFVVVAAVVVATVVVVVVAVSAVVASVVDESAGTIRLVDL